MSDYHLTAVVESLLFAAGEPLSLAKLEDILSGFPDLSQDAILLALQELMERYQHHALELKHLPSGYCIQTRIEYAPWIQRLWAEKPRKYSQALLEVLAIIAYDQPVTRADIEHRRGVAVAPNMIKSLLEREWIKVVGHKDSPGKPALYATTTTFLDYFNLSTLDELPMIQTE
jgi:segregation and condensation protein B